MVVVYKPVNLTYFGNDKKELKRKLRLTVIFTTAQIFMAKPATLRIRYFCNQPVNAQFYKLSYTYRLANQ
jgi:hypothetical protein